MSQYLVRDEVGVRFGISGGVLLLLSAVVVAGRLPPGYGVGLLLVATLLLSAWVDRLPALGLGLAGWAFATGFAVNTRGVLTLAPPDLLRVVVFVAAATLTSGIGEATRALRVTFGRTEWGKPPSSGQSGLEEAMVPGTLSVQRQRFGYLLGVLGPAALVAVLVPLRGNLDLASDALLFLLLVVSTAIVGGLGPALLSGAMSALLLNFYFTEPFHTLQVEQPSEVVAIVVFASVAVMVSWVVDLAARRASAVRMAAELEAGNRLRTALLTAVGHDLRTPLATAKTVVSGLRSPDVALPEEDRRELLESADDALDRLAALIDNLLDLSRLQAGALPVRTHQVPVHDVVARALDDLGVRPRAVVLDVPEDLPDVLVDPGLLERVIVNVVANAQRYTSDPPLLRAVARGDRVELRVIDTGPGIDVSNRDRVFLPFQRLGDTTTEGLGLGLALSRGLMEAMAGTLELEDTPGGGLTMVIVLPSAAASAPSPAPVVS